MRDAEAAGIDGVLLKPVSASLLLDTALQALRPERCESAAPTARRRDPRPPRSSSRLRGARVLLVEDNELNQQVAIELLAAAGFRVDVADNGADRRCKGCSEAPTTWC